MTKTLLKATQLQFGYAGQALLPPLDLKIKAGDLLAVLGRNGCGKTTLFKTLLGLQAPLAGHIDWAIPAPRVSYLAQHLSVQAYSPLAVSEVVAWGCLRGKRFWGLRKLSKQAISEALTLADASHLQQRRFASLSEGERQRVLFARLLCAQADLAFLDEPTAAMDEPAERAVLQKLERLRQNGVAIVLVTHYADLAARYATQVIYLDRDCQEIVQGSYTEVSRATCFRRNFIGEATTL